MEKLLKDIRSAIGRYNLPYQDKEDIIQNSLIYCYSKNLETLPMSYIKQLVHTQVLQFLRPSYFKINLLSETGLLEMAFTNDSIDDSLFEGQVTKALMKVTVIPVEYRPAIADYILSGDTFNEVAERKNLKSDSIRHYFNHYKNHIAKAVTDPSYKCFL
jgi:hypothetical protein